MSLKFEWEQRKAESNVSKHGVSFEEALTVFKDPLARIFDDEDHSVHEQREIIIGHSASGRLLLCCFAVRGDTIRIFSARKVTKGEPKDYEENFES